MSSDEDERMDSFNGGSVDDLCLSLDKASVDNAIMARCIDRQLAEPIAIPNTGPSGARARCGIPKPNLPPFPVFL